VAAALEAQAGEDEDKLIEERRRRRQEILAKHRQQQAAADAAVAPTATDVAADAVAQQDGAAGAPSAAQPAAAAAAPLAPAAAAPPAAAEEAEALPDDEDAVMAELGTEAGGALDIWRHDHDAAAAAAATAAPPPPSGTGEADGEELQRRLAAAAAAQSAQAAADDEDDDVEDIFAATPEDAKRAEAGGGAAGAPAAADAAAPARPRGLVDNYDDAEGYYVFQVGEIVGDRYEVFATHGRGVFASVLRARDLAAAPPAPGAAPPEVAIKVIRANDTMYKAGQTERVILRKLAEADPAGRRHVIRMLGSFEYRHHLCLVFEPMDCNLRELTKRYGRGIGLSLSACRVYAQQLLVALHHLRACGVVHADVKPDNILVNARRTVVKVCDLGSAMFAGDNEITPYLVSRFYRAPEVVLGLPYDHPLDMWSVGCVLFELATGRILFPGRTNNEMLKLMMDAKGPFPRKMLRKGEFAPRHFEPDAGMSFALLEEDKATGRPLRRLVPHPAVKADFAALLAGQSPDRRKLAQLADLLERMLALDPERRITPKEALRHPFIKDAPPAGG
jgi:serine/threonine-protein kinase PRP4